MYSWIRKGKAKSALSSITEGIGQSRVTKNIEGINFDGSYKIRDQNALDIVYDLIKNEGLFLGPTSGINIAGAIKLALEMGPGKTIITVLCDYANRYTSRMFNKNYLKEKNIKFPKWL